MCRADASLRALATLAGHRCCTDKWHRLLPLRPMGGASLEDAAKALPSHQTVLIVADSMGQQQVETAVVDISDITTRTDDICNAPPHTIEAITPSAQPPPPLQFVALLCSAWTTPGFGYLMRDCGDTHGGEAGHEAPSRAAFHFDAGEHHEAQLRSGQHGDEYGNKSAGSWRSPRAAAHQSAEAWAAASLARLCVTSNAALQPHNGNHSARAAIMFRRGERDGEVADDEGASGKSRSRGRGRRNGGDNGPSDAGERERGDWSGWSLRLLLVHYSALQSLGGSHGDHDQRSGGARPARSVASRTFAGRDVTKLTAKAAANGTAKGRDGNSDGNSDGNADGNADAINANGGASQNSPTHSQSGGRALKQPADAWRAFLAAHVTHVVLNGWQHGLPGASQLDRLLDELPIVLPSLKLIVTEVPQATTHTETVTKLAMSCATMHNHNAQQLKRTQPTATIESQHLVTLAPSAQS